MSSPNVKEIRFYRSNNDSYYLTNFFICSFEYDGILFTSSEAAYQYSKFDYPDANEATKEYRLRIAKSKPWPSKILGSQKIGNYPNFPWRLALNPIIEKSYKDGVSPRPDWNDSIKISIMEKVIYLKFSSNNDLKQRLISTEGYTLIEESPDPFWGCGEDGNGKNHLGKILMKLREIFLQEKS